MVEGSVVTAVLVTGLGPGEDRQRNCAQYMDPAHVRLRGKSSTYSDQNMGPECVSRSLAAIGPSLPVNIRPKPGAGDADGHPHPKARRFSCARPGMLRRSGVDDGQRRQMSLVFLDFQLKSVPQLPHPPTILPVLAYRRGALQILISPS